MRSIRRSSRTTGRRCSNSRPNRSLLPFKATSNWAGAHRTTVKRDNGVQIPVNYSLRKTDKGWKAYDVSIEGISYVKSYRTDFRAEIDQKGLDSVIERSRAGREASPQ